MSDLKKVEKDTEEKEEEITLSDYGLTDRCVDLLIDNIDDFFTILIRYRMHFRLEKPIRQTPTAYDIAVKEGLRRVFSYLVEIFLFVSAKAKNTKYEDSKGVLNYSMVLKDVPSSEMTPVKKEIFKILYKHLLVFRKPFLGVNLDENLSLLKLQIKDGFCYGVDYFNLKDSSS